MKQLLETMADQLSTVDVFESLPVVKGSLESQL